MSDVYYWMAAMGLLFLTCLIVFFISMRADLKWKKKLKKTKSVLLINWLYLLISGVTISLLVISFLQIKAQLEIINF